MAVTAASFKCRENAWPLLVNTWQNTLSTAREKSMAVHAPTLISQPSRERTMPETALSKSWKACRNTSESLRKKGSGGGKEKGQRRGKATLSRQIKNLSKQSLSDRSQKVVTFFVLLTSSKWCKFFLVAAHAASQFLQIQLRPQICPHGQQWAVGGAGAAESEAGAAAAAAAARPMPRARVDLTSRLSFSERKPKIDAALAGLGCMLS